MIGSGSDSICVETERSSSSVQEGARQVDPAAPVKTSIATQCCRQKPSKSKLCNEISSHHPHLPPLMTMMLGLGCSNLPLLAALCGAWSSAHKPASRTTTKSFVHQIPMEEAPRSQSQIFSLSARSKEDILAPMAGDGELRSRGIVRESSICLASLICRPDGGRRFIDTSSGKLSPQPGLALGAVPIYGTPAKGAGQPPHVAIQLHRDLPVGNSILTVLLKMKNYHY